MPEAEADPGVLKSPLNLLLSQVKEPKIQHQQALAECELYYVPDLRYTITLWTFSYCSCRLGRPEGHLMYLCIY